MANTKIQIKRSSATATPTNGSLSAGELAYSYNSDKLFLGTANSANVQEIGGTYWVNTTIAAFDKANNASAQGMDYPFVNTAANSANSYAVTIGAASNTWANTIAQNWANTRLANVVATAGRTTVTWSTTNGYTNATVDLATTTVTGSTYGGATQIPVFTVDSYGRLTYAANVAVQGMDYAFANGVANSANAYAATVGASGNNYSNTLYSSALASGNNAANSANAYGTATFYAKSGGTISGDVVVTGNLTVSGQTTYTNTNTLLVGDNIITLNADLPIGSAPTENAGIEVNRGSALANSALFWNETTDKWQISSNIQLGSTYVNIASNTDVENYAVAGNNYAVQVGAASNTWANGLSTIDRAIANSAANSSNAYTVTVGAASNTWANTIAQNWANTRLANVIATSGRTVVTWSTTNGYTNATLDLATTTVAAATYGGTDQIASFTVDAYGRLTFAGNNGINVGAATSGTLPVARGGTGNTTFTANSVLIGNGTSPVWGLFSSTEGHVLQVSAAGAPQFAMLDGGNF